MVSVISSPITNSVGVAGCVSTNSNSLNVVPAGIFTLVFSKKPTSPLVLPRTSILRSRTAQPVSPARLIHRLMLMSVALSIVKSACSAGISVQTSWSPFSSIRTSPSSLSGATRERSSLSYKYNCLTPETEGLAIFATSVGAVDVTLAPPLGFTSVALLSIVVPFGTTPIVTSKMIDTEPLAGTVIPLTDTKPVLFAPAAGSLASADPAGNATITRDPTSEAISSVTLTFSAVVPDVSLKVTM